MFLSLFFFECFNPLTENHVLLCGNAIESLDCTDASWDLRVKWTAFHLQTYNTSRKSNETRWTVKKHVRCEKDDVNFVDSSLYFYVNTIGWVHDIVKLVYVIMITHIVSQLCVFSGLGYITGAGIATLTGDWHWALRVRTFSSSVNVNVSWPLTESDRCFNIFLCHQFTPILGVVGLFLLLFLCPNPPRGAAETHGEGVTKQSTYLEDIKYLLKK